MKFNKSIFICIILILLIVLYFVAFNDIESFSLFTIGIVVLIFGVALILNTYRCKERVSALLVDYGFEQYKAHITSSPIFKYTYQGKEYTQKAAESLSQRYALKHFKEGEMYFVYISPQNPSFLKINRHIRVFDLILCLLGMIMIVLSILP